MRRVHGGEAAASARARRRRPGRLARSAARRPPTWPSGAASSTASARPRRSPWSSSPAAQGRLPRRPGPADHLARPGRAGAARGRRLLVPHAWPCAGCWPLDPAGRRPDGDRAAPPAAERRALVVQVLRLPGSQRRGLLAGADAGTAEARSRADEEEEDLYGAAYEDVTYQDSTDDDEGAVSDGGGRRRSSTWKRESERLEKRLRFLSTLARLWQIAARFLAGRATAAGRGRRAVAGRLAARRPATTSSGCWRCSTPSTPIRCPSRSARYDSLVEYDRRRVLKEQLLYTTIGTCLDTDAGRRRPARARPARGDAPADGARRRAAAVGAVRHPAGTGPVPRRRRTRPARRCRRSSSTSRPSRCCSRR